MTAHLKAPTYRNADKTTAFDTWGTCTHLCVWCRKAIVHWDHKRWRCPKRCHECVARELMGTAAH